MGGVTPLIKRMKSMKKMIFAVLALGALAACTKNDVTPVDNGPQEITFQTVISPETKADAAFSTSNKFRSYAYLLTDNKTWAANSGDGQEYIHDELISYNTTDKVWRGENKHYWPKDSKSKLTFFSWTVDTANDPETDFSGVTVNCTNTNGITVSGYDATVNKNADFMTAFQADQTKNTDVPTDADRYPNWTKGVPTIFKHALSSFAFTVKLDGTYDKHTFKFNSISFDQIVYKGNFTQGEVTDGSWGVKNTWNPDASSTKGDFPMFTNTSGVEFDSDQEDLYPATATDYFILMPQDIPDAAVITIKYQIEKEVTSGTPVTENVTLTEELNSIYTSDWLPGKKYTLNITIGMNEVLWDPQVSDWEVGTVASGALTI